MQCIACILACKQVILPHFFNRSTISITSYFILKHIHKELSYNQLLLAYGGYICDCYFPKAGFDQPFSVRDLVEILQSG